MQANQHGLAFDTTFKYCFNHIEYIYKTEICSDKKRTENHLDIYLMRTSNRFLTIVDFLSFWFRRRIVTANINAKISL